MKRLVLACACALLLVGCGRSEEAQPEDDGIATAAMNTLSAEEQAAGWQLLFDGETTDGWHNYRADTLSPMWTVEDGTLKLVGRGGGDIVTDDTFGAFELALEWKISDCGNGGLFFHVQEEHDVIWTGAPEYQLLDNTCADDRENPTHQAAANYDIHAPSEDATKPAGQWNQTRLIVSPQGRVQHYLNGVKVVEYTLGSDAWRAAVDSSKFAPFEHYGMAKSGAIGLQDHGDPLWLRNIKIRPLSSDVSFTDAV